MGFGSAGTDPDDTTIEKNVSGRLQIKLPYQIPIGIPFGWCKDLVAGTSVENLPTGWVECNGQVINDPASPLDGKTIPDLNGNNQFLRGDSTSGGTGGAETHNHTNSLTGVSRVATWNNTGTNTGLRDIGGGESGAEVQTISSESGLPPYYNVVWIIRIK